MALWKISVKRSGNINGVRIEKGMSIEFVCNCSSNPLGFAANKQPIAQLFQNKYGIDLDKAHLVGPSYLECERMDK